MQITRSCWLSLSSLYTPSINTTNWIVEWGLQNGLTALMELQEDEQMWLLKVFIDLYIYLLLNVLYPFFILYKPSLCIQCSRSYFTQTKLRKVCELKESDRPMVTSLAFMAKGGLEPIISWYLCLLYGDTVAQWIRC